MRGWRSSDIPLREWVAAGCFALLLILSIKADDFPRPITDERAQLSYALQLRDAGFRWLSPTELRLYDMASRQPVDAPNYLNHPPTAYYLPAALLALWPAMPVTALRGVGALVGMAAFLAYIAVGRQLPMSRAASMVYLAFPCLAYLPSVAATVNIDAAPMLGGCLLALGALRWQRWLLVAGWLLMSVKLNSLLLAAFFMAGFCAFHVPPVRWRQLWPLAAAGLLSALPYLWLYAQTGSPAPLTPGQAQLLQALAAQQTPMHWPFLTYAWHALLAFPRGHIGSGVYLHFYQLLFGLLGLAMLAALRWRRSAFGLATVGAFLAVLLIQLVYCYARYRQFGWFGDYYPRYYIGLMPGFGYLLALPFTARGT